MEGRTVERHLNIFSIFFLGKINADSLVWPHGNQAKVFLCDFSFAFHFFIFVCSRNRGRHFFFSFHFFFIFFHFFFFFQSVRCGRVKMNYYYCFYLIF
ncbi:hypothetical protein TCDM_11452 [Trypanosoma cruzi Dm28c]|uniref:Uncharacterized protein n=1 Tax=Trypanosoma cruzi Dm28c TaxID=1416333 RepID=V5AK00_TRYCR|nr:hypothetical protein TCDM_11452 [Trypanosoma cruzi Dm28c]